MLNAPQRPTCQQLGPRQHYWEVAEPLGSEALWKALRSFGVHSWSWVPSLLLASWPWGEQFCSILIPLLWCATLSQAQSIGPTGHRLEPHKLWAKTKPFSYKFIISGIFFLNSDRKLTSANSQPVIKRYLTILHRSLSCLQF